MGQSVSKCLFFDVRFIDQKDRDVILHGIYTAALRALELVLLFVVGERRFAGRTGENFEQISADHAHILPPLHLCASTIASCAISS